jgi:hypothetical protein
MAEDKAVDLWEEIKRWAQDHRFGDLAVILKIHQGKIVGVEELPEKTKRIIKT